MTDRTALRGSKSIFRLPIDNALGIEAMEARNELKNFALQRPAEYTELRGKVYVAVVKHMVQQAHNTLWELLTEGKQPDGTNITIPGVGIGAGKQWRPNLPEQEIGKLANGYAESMMHAFEDIMQKIMPDDYKGLAEDKLMNISKVNGVNKALGVGAGAGAGSGSSS